MTVPTNQPGVRRTSILSRLFPFADRPRVGDSADVRVGPVTSRQAANGADSEGEREPGPPLPETRLYLEARRQIKRRAWGHAQRALEAAEPRDADGQAELDLASVRSLRRALRRAARWPSDVESHLALGRAYFELELGDDALAEFVLAQRLAPRRCEGFVMAALEYLYRGEYATAMSAWTRAADLRPDLPPFEELLHSVAGTARSR